jgi:hypothetical protein
MYLSRAFEKLLKKRWVGYFLLPPTQFLRADDCFSSALFPYAFFACYFMRFLLVILS